MQRKKKCLLCSLLYQHTVSPEVPPINLNTAAADQRLAADALAAIKMLLFYLVAKLLAT